METFRVEVGHQHGVKPGNLVGAIANEAGIDSEFIGRIDIQDAYSTIDLPEGMPDELFQQLKKVWVSGQRLNITRADELFGGAAPKPPGHDPRQKMQRPDRKGGKPSFAPKGPRSDDGGKPGFARGPKGDKGGKFAKGDKFAKGGKPFKAKKKDRPVLGKSGAKKGGSAA